MKAYLAGERRRTRFTSACRTGSTARPAARSSSARTCRTTRKLARAIRASPRAKGLLGLRRGAVTPDAGRWEDYLYKVDGEPRAEVVAADHPEGRHGRAALPRLEIVRLGHVAGNRVGNRPHASNPHPSRLARPPRTGGQAVRLARSPLVHNSTTSGCRRSRCTPGV